MRNENFEQQLLELSPGEKARLLDELVHSLDNATQAGIDAIWLDEAERRDREMDQSGDNGPGGAAAWEPPVEVSAEAARPREARIAAEQLVPAEARERDLQPLLPDGPADDVTESR